MSEQHKKVHFIAIGGSTMHGLAIALHLQGITVSGSDDQIYGLAKTNLEKHGLLPSPGWNAQNISKDIDAIILGMHAKKDNPELLKAQELGLKIYSYPAYILSRCEDKQRIVIAGSHGKTSITAMVMHVLKTLNHKFDYLIGSKVPGFENVIRLSDAPIVIIEGDEYLSSPIDLTPKFLHYKHHIGLISGIAWDHVNVFPTEDEYVKQFDLFADNLPKAGSIVYCEEDAMATVIGRKERDDVNRFEYKTHPHEITGGKTYLITDNGKVGVNVFGKHNMQNIAGAKELLMRLRVTPEEFYASIASFEGAARRLESIGQNNDTIVYKDFAHAPSKVDATVKAVKAQSERKLVACLELHTFSSLSKQFLPQYNGKMSSADEAIVYFNPTTIANKRLEPIDEAMVINAFGQTDLKVFTDSNALENYLKENDWAGKNLLMMSSGDFGGIDVDQLGTSITS